MNQFKKSISLLLCLLFTSNIQAVSLSPNGQGEVLLFPYYTVNNELNTLYSVVNTTNQAKAVRVRFLEGEAGRVVFLINLYLAPHDVWTAVLVPVTSSQSSHEGEPSVAHITNDNSCAPFLNKSFAEFLPSQIDMDGGNNNMQRTRDGHIEIIEMGVVTGTSALAISHSSGVPENCDLIEDAWQPGGFWDIDPTTEISNPSGGLIGYGQLINVPEGLSFSYDAEALEGFWRGTGIHGAPDSSNPDLADAHPTSAVLLNNEVLTSQWETGFEAVSAVLMKNQIYNEFDLSPGNLSQSEWVATFPTKSYHTFNTPVVPPFENIWDVFTSCDEFRTTVFDREKQQFILTDPNFLPAPPPGRFAELCYSTNTFQLFAGQQPPIETVSGILGADNLITAYAFDTIFNTEGGWLYLDFNFNIQSMNPISGEGYQGMPVIGFHVNQFTNNNAQPGLIAQYGRLSKHSSKRGTL